MNIPRYTSSTVFVAVLLSALTTSALAAEVYKVEPLGLVAGGSEFTTVTDINASGAAAGHSNFGEDFTPQALYWNSAGQLTQLTPGDVRISSPAGISDAGTVVYSESGRIFSWDAGIVTDLGLGYASAVNGKGQIAGTFGGVFGIWTNGVVSPLPSPSPVTGSDIKDINNNADAVGAARFTDTNTVRAVIWRNGTVQEIGVLPGDVKSVANAINDIGQVVGYSENSSRKQRAFLWENGVIRDLGFPVGAESSAFGINNAGQITGRYFTPNTPYGLAFVWQNGVFRALSPELGAGNCGAYDINNVGQIIASCTKADYTAFRPFRLSPIAMAADLSVTLNATPIPATAGLPLVYTVTVTNLGNVIAADATLTQTLPVNGFIFGSVVSSKGSCTGASVVNCAFGNLAGGESAVVTISVTALPSDVYSSYYESSVVVATSTPDVNPNNNAAKLPFTVFANNAALSVHTVRSQLSAVRNGNITYTWEISNGGPLAARNVTLTDTLPSSLSFVSVNTTAGTCTGTVTIKCNMGEHRFGPTRVTIVAKAKVRGTITNRATVTSTTPDTYLGDNTDTVVTRVR